VMLITVQGMVNRTHVSEIRIVGRNTQGVRIMDLNEGDKIASFAKVAKEDDEPPSESETSPDTPPADATSLEPEDGKSVPEVPGE
jgi:DNA gyrase subunit A